MKNQVLTRVIVASFVLCPLRSATAQPPEFDTEAIDNSVALYMNQNEVPGVVLGIVVGDAVVYAKSYGVIDASTNTPMQVNTTFQVASVTKLFTASLMVALEQDGVLSIGDPVDKYLDGAAVPRDARCRAIRLMDLATHTSGLPTDPLNRRDRPNSPTVMEPYSRADLYEALATTELLFPTGGDVEYSNFGFGLLGHALERAAGAPLEEVMRKRLWEPLGMNSTYVFDRPDGASDLAGAHWDWYSPRKPSPPREFGDIWGMGGLHSTMADLARFLSLQFRASSPEENVIDGHRLAEMHKPHVLMSSSFDDENPAFGIGWIVKPMPGAGSWIEHDGNNDGQSAYIGGLPEKGIGVVVLANLGGIADEIAEEAVLPIMLLPVTARVRDLSEAWRNGDWETVRASETEFLTWNRNNFRARYFLARALLELGRFEEAGPHLEAVFAAGKFRWMVPFDLAVCAADAGQVELAGELLQRAFDLGFRDGERNERYPALKVLADHPIYQLLIKRYGAHH